MKFIFKICLFLLFVTTIFASNNSKVYLEFSKANNLFHKREYNKAVNLYKNIYKHGISNGYLFYNIGTCYLKEGKLGKALYWYNKAKFFIPLNSSLNKNIQIAISKVEDNIANKTFFHYLNSFFILGDIFSIKINFYITSFLFWFLILSLILKNFVINLKYRYLAKRAVIIAGISWIIFAGNFAFQYYKYRFLNLGYITKSNTEVKDDFNLNANNIATLNDGTQVFILSKNNNFFKVKLPDGLEGWILKNRIICRENE